MRDTAVAMQSSRIREVANTALKNPDVLAFWFGESDEVTPAVVREAAARSLERGETFYGHNLGLIELREGWLNTRRACTLGVTPIASRSPAPASMR